MEQRDKEILLESAIKVATFCINGVALTYALVGAAAGIIAASTLNIAYLINGRPEGKEDGWMYRSPIDIIKAVSNYKGNSSSSTGEGNSVDTETSVSEDKQDDTCTRKSRESEHTVEQSTFLGNTEGSTEDHRAESGDTADAKPSTDPLKEDQLHGTHDESVEKYIKKYNL